jgi:hypothetical protein
MIVNDPLWRRLVVRARGGSDPALEVAFDAFLVLRMAFIANSCQLLIPAFEYPITLIHLVSILLLYVPYTSSRALD